MLLGPKSLTGNPAIDKPINDLWEAIALANSRSSSSSTKTNSSHIITDLGAMAYKFDNTSGVALLNGVNVEYYNGGVTLSGAGSRSNFGVVAGTWPPYGPCYVVINGPCYVYFNSNGATAGHWFRMARANDTANPDSGMAQSLPVSTVDPLQYLGIVLESRTGEGVAKCIKIR